MLALVVMSSLRAQSDCDEIYLSAINRALNEGDCKDAQRFYEAYKACTEGRTNMAIERRIQECLNPPKKNGDVEIIKVGNVVLWMVYVEGGTFRMGCTYEQGDDCRDEERPTHQVTLDGYYIGETEVTQALWREVMGSEPTANSGWITELGRGDNYPAYNVSYEDVQEFIKRLNKMTGRTFRLPTEAEWEYASRGGNKSRGYKYSGSNNIDDVAWYWKNSGDGYLSGDWNLDKIVKNHCKNRPVKGKLANELGLYDMTGNVLEWCQDWYGEYNSGSQRNPQGPSSGPGRVVRGGCFCYSARFCLMSTRNKCNPSICTEYLGFRLVLEPVETSKPTTSKKNDEIKTIRVGNVDLRMVYVEGGTFTMGCTYEQSGECDDDEKPTHQVMLDDYYIGETEVTQALWREVMGSEPTENGGWTTKYGRGNNYPAYYVSYEDVQEFIKRINRKTGLTFRLPTEAEWEYASRGGNKSRGYKYSGSNDINNVAWYDGNSDIKTHPVKSKQANELGLYDMSGNVWEWCQDLYGNYGSDSLRNPQEPSSGSDCVNRGGAWGSDARYCRVTNRDYDYPSHGGLNVGFRLVLEASK